MLIVKKFGGSSLGNADKIKNAARIVARDYRGGNSQIIVVSAQENDTDRLLAQGLDICDAPSARELDVLLATGEQKSMALLAITLNAMGCTAVSLCGWQAGILTEEKHGVSRIMGINSKRIGSELAQNRIVIVAGFQGVTPNGDITTIGRGGSDTTAVALAAEFKADICQIYTDVAGIYSADPRLIKNAVKHYEIGYDEMLELASLGAKVLHNRSVILAKKYGVPFEVLSSLEDKTGTKVREVSMEQKNVSGIARDTNIVMVAVNGLPKKAGIAAKLFGILAENEINVDMIIQPPMAENGGSIYFSVPESKAQAVAAALCDNESELGFKGFVVEDNVAKVSIVGAGMVSHCGVAAEMLAGLSAAGIEAKYITTGEIKISVIVEKTRAEDAVILIHDIFF